MPVDVAVVGTGYMGSNHVRVLDALDEARLIGVFDVDASRAHLVERRYGIRCFKKLEDIAGMVDAVAVATPPENHFETARFFLENSVNVFLEKPVAVSVRDADYLAQLARRKGLVLQVGHIERFNAAYEAVRDTITRPLMIECMRLNPPDNRAGSDIDVVMDLMLHDIDICMSLVHSTPLRISAFSPENEERYRSSAAVQIVFENGTAANLIASRLCPVKLRQMTVMNCDSLAHCDLIERKVTRYCFSADRSRAGDNPGFALSPNGEELEIGDRREPLLRQMAHFISCVRNHSAPLVGGPEAAGVLRAVHAVLDSFSSENR